VCTVRTLNMPYCKASTCIQQQNCSSFVYQ
jgi:hypothetical protein